LDDLRKRECDPRDEGGGTLFAEDALSYAGGKIEKEGKFRGSATIETHASGQASHQDQQQRGGAGECSPQGFGAVGLGRSSNGEETKKMGQMRLATEIKGKTVVKSAEKKMETVSGQSPNCAIAKLAR